mmetsp:Transcript_24209/g.52210  ORF Transcript_24209/g.52210 Transcript_24209/m.52210 type:complete len:157 (+) Transcript_24209:207-677(+)
MVEISTKKKSSYSAGAYFTHFVYFSLLAAVAIIGQRRRAAVVTESAKINADLESAKKTVAEVSANLSKCDSIGDERDGLKIERDKLAVKVAELLKEGDVLRSRLENAAGAAATAVDAANGAVAAANHAHSASAAEVKEDDNDGDLLDRRRRLGRRR